MNKVYVVTGREPVVEAIAVAAIYRIEKERVQLVFEKHNFKNRNINALADYLKARRGQIIYVADATSEQYVRAAEKGFTFGTFAYNSKGFLISVAYVKFISAFSFDDAGKLIKRLKYDGTCWDVQKIVAEMENKCIQTSRLNPGLKAVIMN